MPHRADGLRRADVSDLSGLPGRAHGIHPGTGQGLPGGQCPASRRREPGPQRPAHAASSARSSAKTEGVAHTIDLAGYSTILSTNISNVGGMFVILAPFEERAGKQELSAPAIMAQTAREVRGVPGSADRRLRGPARRGSGQHGRVQAAGARTTAARGSGPCREPCRTSPSETRTQPGLVGVFSTFSVAQPQLFVEIDREKVKAQNVSLDEVHTTLQAYLGSAYVNDFSFQNRNWQVNVQADPRYRIRVEDIGKLEVRNADGQHRAAPHAGPRQEHQRPGDRQSLQPLSVRGTQRRIRRRGSVPARRSP